MGTGDKARPCRRGRRIMQSEERRAHGISIRGGVSVSEVLDLIIVGGGPCGLACAVAARRHGLSHLMFEKGPFLNTLVRFPETMTFFSSAELLEIGDIPFSLPHLRPTRAEGIAYFQKVEQRENVKLHSFEIVTEVVGWLGDMYVMTVICLS